MFYYIWGQVHPLTKYKLEINIFKRELARLLYYRKLYTLLYQYRIAIHIDAAFIQVYGGYVWNKRFLSIESAITSESYFWEPYIAKNEEKIWKSQNINPKTVMGDINKINKVSSIWELDDEDSDEEDKNIEVKKKEETRVVKRPKKGEPIPTWTIPTWLYYKQKYKRFSRVYDLEIYFSSESKSYKFFSNLLYYKELGRHLLKSSTS